MTEMVVVVREVSVAPGSMLDESWIGNQNVLLSFIQPKKRVAIPVISKRGIYVNMPTSSPMRHSASSFSKYALAAKTSTCI